MRPLARARSAVLPTLVAAAAVLLAACSGASTGAGTSASPAASTGAGTTATADPGVVVALDDFAMINALSLGVVPDLVFDAFGYETSKALYREYGITAQPYGNELAVEKVIAAKPDVILGVSLPTTVAQKATLEKLAPTTVLDYTADWRTQLTQTGAALGRAESAAALERRITTGLDTLKRDLAASPHAGAVVSVLGDREGAFSPPEKTGIGSLLDGLGLDRPNAQKVDVPPTAPFVLFSAENLTSHDGEVLYLLAGSGYPTRAFTGSPLWNRLRAVKAGAVHEVSGETWLGSSPLAVQWVLDDVRATLLGGGKPAGNDQAGAKLKALASGG